MSSFGDLRIDEVGSLTIQVDAKRLEPAQGQIIHQEMSENHPLTETSSCENSSEELSVNQAAAPAGDINIAEEITIPNFPISPAISVKSNSDNSLKLPTITIEELNVLQSDILKDCSEISLTDKKTNEDKSTSTEPEKEPANNQPVKEPETHEKADETEASLADETEASLADALRKLISHRFHQRVEEAKNENPDKESSKKQKKKLKKDKKDKKKKALIPPAEIVPSNAEIERVESAESIILKKANRISAENRINTFSKFNLSKLSGFHTRSKITSFSS